MANPQTQANGGQETTAAEKGGKQERTPSLLHWRWWVFWAGRSGWRTVLGLILAIPLLLAGAYIALPASDQAQINAVIQAVGQALGATGLRVGAEVVFVVYALICFSLLFAPRYRKARALHLPTSFIPPITVYVDAENLTDPKLRSALIDHLRREFLVGKRAKTKTDLLFFMDAQDARQAYRPINTPKGIKQVPVPKSHYEAFYKNGFRLINSPHIFTGASDTKEAVDREIAMHAFERALTSEHKQEFIIVSGDGGFAPLIYRLIALGHSVQIWMWGETRAYSDAAKYLPITVYNLETRSYVIPKKAAPVDSTTDTPRNESAAAEPAMPKSTIAGEQRSAGQQPSQPPKSKKSKLWTKRLPANKPNRYVPPPTSLTLEGQKRLYYAIAETLSMWRYCADLRGLATDAVIEDQIRSDRFDDLLSNVLSARIKGVGYTTPSRVEYWKSHLLAVGAFTSTPGVKFPGDGSSDAEESARWLYALATHAAQAAVNTTPTRPDRYLNMEPILATLAAEELDSEMRAMLDPLILSGQRRTHIRYLVHCAGALGIIAFDDFDASGDLIKNLRLIGDTKQPEFGIQPNAQETPDAPDATV